MERNAEFNISIIEILLIIKRKWKMVIASVLVLAAISGVYGVLSSSDKENEQTTKQQVDLYEGDVNTYELIQEQADAEASILREKWAKISDDYTNNPIHRLNPYQCEFDKIVVGFEDKDSNYGRTLDVWVSGVDGDKLFGSAESELNKYRNLLIRLDSPTYETDEASITIISTDSFDSEKCADVIKGIIKENAQREDIKISHMSSVHKLGYCSSVGDYQKLISDQLNSLNSTLNNLANMQNVIKEPVNPVVESHSLLVDIVKYGLVGAILGLIIGVVIAFLPVYRKSTVISGRQIEETFGLELLGDFSKGSAAALDVLNANLDIMSGQGSSVMMMDNTVILDEGLLARWSIDSDRTFISGRDLYDDVNTIEKLHDVAGIVLGVHFGESKLDEIQRVMIRANKLNKRVLGYVVL